MEESLRTNPFLTGLKTGFPSTSLLLSMLWILICVDARDRILENVTYTQDHALGHVVVVAQDRVLESAVADPQDCVRASFAVDARDLDLDIVNYAGNDSVNEGVSLRLFLRLFEYLHLLYLELKLFESGLSC